MAAPTVPARKAGPSVGQRVAQWWTKSAKNLDLFDENQVDKVKTDPWYMLGGMALLFWYITIATGTILIFFYVPDASGPIYQSWLSVKNILEGEHGFLVYLIRQMHKYGADALIVCLTIRIYRMYFRGEFKNYNQLSYIVTIIALILAMFSGLTGYLLIWNQRALWATKVFATFPTFVDSFHEIPTLAVYFTLPGGFNPVTWLLQNTLGQLQIGNLTANFMLAGQSIGPATLTRFYSAHFMLSILAIIAVEAYFARKGRGGKIGEAGGGGGAGRFRRINLPWYGVVFSLVVLTIVSIAVPVDTGSPANYNVTPNPILSDWYFLGLYQMMKLWKPATATLQTLLIPLIAFAVVFFDASPERSPWKRPFWTMVGIYALVAWIAFSVLICLNIADIKRDPPWVYLISMIMLGIGAIWHWVYKAGERRKQKAIEAEKVAKAAALAAAQANQATD
jgi:ubiquinol-cytochrome c reductase cytochrome b subunit